MLNSAIIFPGQGSQSVGMMSDLAAKYPLVVETFREVSDKLGFDVWKLVQEDPSDLLDQTEYTQVAMLTADVAVYRVMQSLGADYANKAEIKVSAGHSLGEYAALVCANAIELADAAWLVRMRGQLMQKTIPLGHGAMAAIVGLSNEEVDDICAQASSETEMVSPANYNAVGQVVVAGHTGAVEKAIAIALAKEAKLAKTIPVTVPCHCSLLSDAAKEFAMVLQEMHFNVPDIPVISNVDLSIYNSTAQIRDLLARQLYSPVQWVKTVQLIQSFSVDVVLECGPGKVLSGLVKHNPPKINTKLL